MTIKCLVVLRWFRRRAISTTFEDVTKEFVLKYRRKGSNMWNVSMTNPHFVALSRAHQDLNDRN
jgi:hypothetical protein